MAEERIQIEGLDQLTAPPTERIQLEGLEDLATAPAPATAPAEGAGLPGLVAPTAREDTIVQTSEGPIVSAGVLGDPDIPTVPEPEELERYQDYQASEIHRRERIPTKASEARTVGEFFEISGQSFRELLQPIHNGINSGAAGFYDVLDRSAALVSDMTGTSKVDLFEYLRDTIPSSTPSTTLPGKVMEGLSAAPFVIGEFMAAGKIGKGLGVLDRVFKTGQVFGKAGTVMGFGALGAIERYGDGTEEMVHGAAEYALLGMNLNAISALPVDTRSGIMASLFGGMAALNGEGTEDITAATISGLFLGRMGGKGDPNLSLTGEIRSIVRDTAVGKKFMQKRGVEAAQGDALVDIAENIVSEHMSSKIDSLRDAEASIKEGQTLPLKSPDIRKLLDLELNNQLGEKFHHLKVEDKIKSVLDRVDKNNIISDKVKQKYIERTLRTLDEAQTKMDLQTEAARDLDQSAVDASAKRVSDGFRKTDSMLKQAEEPVKTRLLNWSRRGMIDASGQMKAALIKEGGIFGEKAVRAYNRMAGASARSSMWFGEMEKSVLKGLSEPDTVALSEIVFSRRTMTIAQDRAARGKKPVINPNSATAGDHTRALISLRQKLGEKKFTELDELATKYFDWTKGTVRELQKSGLISEAEYNTLIKLDWSKRIFLDRIDPEINVAGKPRRVDVRETGVDPLAGGSKEAAIYDIREIAAQVAVRTASRVARNNANRALHDFAEAFPENNIVRFPKKFKMNKAGTKVKSVQVPHGFLRIDTFIDGIQRPMLLNEAFADQWVTSNTTMPVAMANAMRIVSLGALLRPLATGINPAFALTNFPRDVLHAWLTTSEYSTAAPKFAFQLTKDLLKTRKDAWRKEGAYRDYIDEGGGMSFLTHQGMQGLTGPMGRSVPRSEVDPSSWGRAKASLGKLNEMSELWMRLALRERALRNGKSAEEATSIAREYLDFAQGGTYTKGLDHMFAYLNASVQGIRGIGRQMTNREDAMRLGAKVLQLQTIEAMMQLGSYAVNPEAAAAVSTKDQIGNWIITLPLEPWTDSQGNKRYWYIPIAKDPSVVAMLAPVTAAMNKFLHGRAPPGWLRATFDKSVPAPFVGTTIPAAEAYYGYIANKDMWTGRDIWRGGNVPPSEEIRTFRRGVQPTPLVYEAWGDITELSPVRSEWFVNKISADNPYVQVMGKGFRMMTEGFTPQDLAMTSEELIKETPMLKRVLKATHPYAMEADIMEDPIRGANAAKLSITSRFDELMELNAVGQLAGGKGAIDAFVRSQDPVTQDRLYRRGNKKSEIDRLRVRIGQMDGIPSVSWWFRLSLAESAEARAAAYYQSWLGSPNRAGMERIASQIQGFNTSSFQYALTAEKKQYGTNPR